MKSIRTTNALEIDFRWQKDSKGYVLEDHGKYGLWVCRRGGELVPTYPLRGGYTFSAFANVSSSKDLVEFVNRHGLLDDVEGSNPAFFHSDKGGNLLARKGAPAPEGEDVHGHLRTAGCFRELVRFRTQGGKASPELAAWLDSEVWGEKGLGEVQLVYDRHRWFRPVFKPSSFMSGMLWQLTSSVGGGAQHRSCAHCGAIFEVGAGSGLRTDAKFCSAEHRIVFNSRKRSLR